MRRLLWLLLVTCLAGASQAAPLCASPGQDGSISAQGVINDYWAAPKGVSLSAGQTRLPLGEHLGRRELAPGDLLLVIQMQGADINSSNDARYGSGQGEGSGWLSLTAGRFELVRVQRQEKDAVVISGAGAGAGLQFSYVYRDPHAKADQGQARWQLVRVPQYRDLTLTGDLQAAAWNGALGGVLALDVRGTLALAGHDLDASGRGFRGGAALPLRGALGAASDYRYEAPSAQNLASRYGQHGSKGEGLAGTPRWLFAQDKRIETLPDAGRNSSDGYPGGSMARGAPANAGGGGEALSLDNRTVSGGGGGGGAVAGGKGTAANGKALGGLGGAGVASRSSTPLLVMGGGGGASALGGLPAWQGAGGTGGGILLLSAGEVVGKGALDVSGGKGRNGPAGGGGGGGGSLLLWLPTHLARTVSLQLIGGTPGKGPQGAGGVGAQGRSLVTGGVTRANAAVFEASAWPGVHPGFVCQPQGLVLTGLVFDAGQALSAREAQGLEGWPYRLLSGKQTLASGMTDAAGRFSLLLPKTVLSQSLLLDVALPPGWATVAATRDAATGLAYLGDGNWRLQPTTSGYYQELRLGVVRGPQLLLPKPREVSVNSTQIFPIRYVARADGQVSFAASVTLAGKADAASLLFLDPHCDGHSQFAANGKSQVFDVKAGQTFCVRLRVEVGKEQLPGSELEWQLEARSRVKGLAQTLLQTKRQRFDLLPAVEASP